MIYRYCQFEKLDRATKMGWHIIGPLPPPHGYYSMLICWMCDCPAPWFS